MMNAESSRSSDTTPNTALSVAALVALVLALAACGESTGSIDPQRGVTPKPVKLAILEPSLVGSSVTTPGIVEAHRRIALSFRAEGFVSTLHVDEGDRVDQGSLLGELDRDPFDRALRDALARLSAAKARTREAERDLDRRRQLMNRGAGSQERYEDAKLDLKLARAAQEQARVAVDTARDQLEKVALRAPLAGTVEKRLVEVHERSTLDRPAFVLTQLDPVTVAASISDRRSPELRIGTSAWIQSRAIPEERLSGRVTRIGAAADPSSRTIPFELTVANPSQLLIPQLSVTVEVPLGDPDKLLLVPMRAVLRDVDRRPFCFRAVDRGRSLRAERADVILGAMHGEQVEIRSGLQAGDRVVVQGQHFLRPGDLVQHQEG